jgi:hypothetical protein
MVEFPPSPVPVVVYFEITLATIQNPAFWTCISLDRQAYDSCNRGAG